MKNPLLRLPSIALLPAPSLRGEGPCKMGTDLLPEQSQLRRVDDRDISQFQVGLDGGEAVMFRTQINLRVASPAESICDVRTQSIPKSMSSMGRMTSNPSHVTRKGT